MLGLLLTAALTLGPRPADLVEPGQDIAYAQWLDGQARKAASGYARVDCASAVLTPQSFKPAVDAAIAKALPGAVLYVERLAVQGCGEARAQSVIVMRQGSSWRAFPTAPGESLASLELQRQVLPNVILAVKTASDGDTSCSGLDKARSALVYDTRVIRAAAGEGQSWTERWFMAVCDAGYKIDIDFTPRSVDGAAERIAYDVHIAPQPATATPGLGLLGQDHGE
jgi:hypothetical protein